MDKNSKALVTIVAIALTISLGAVAIEVGLLNTILPKGDNDQNQNTNETTGLPDTIPNPEPTPTPIDTTPNANDIDDTQPEPGPVPEPTPVPDPKPTPVPIFTPVPVPEPTPTPVPEPVTVPETHDYSGKGNGVTDYFYLDKGVHFLRVNVTQDANDKFALNLVSRSGDVYSLLVKDRTGSYQGDLCIGIGEMPSPHDGEGYWYIHPDNFRLEVTSGGSWTIDMWEPNGKGRVLPQTFKGSTDAVYSLYLPGNYTNVEFSLSYTGSGFVAVYLWSALSNAQERVYGEGAFGTFLYPAIDGVSERTITIGGYVPDENFGPWYYPPAGVYYVAILAEDANYTLTVK